jgi:hypothetical protein
MKLGFVLGKWIRVSNEKCNCSPHRVDLKRIKCQRGITTAHFPDGQGANVAD